MNFSSNTHTNRHIQRRKVFLAQLSQCLPVELFMFLLGRMTAASFESWDLFVIFQYFLLHLHWICLLYKTEFHLVHYHGNNHAIDPC